MQVLLPNWQAGKAEQLLKEHRQHLMPGVEMVRFLSYLLLVFKSPVVSVHHVNLTVVRCICNLWPSDRRL
jgi:hypothetical protein